MQIITLKDGANMPFTNYNDGDVFICNDFKTVQYSHEPMKMAMTMIVLCIEGSGTIVLNDKTYNFAPNDMITIAPNTIVTEGASLANSKFRILAFEIKNFTNAIILNTDIWKNTSFIRSNPVCKLSDYQYKVMNHYFELAYLYVQNTNDMYQKEKMNNLIRCWIYDLMTIISEYSYSNTYDGKTFSSKDIIFKRFLEVLSLHNGKIRHVHKAAELLCVSPKYLSFAIKQASGKTPRSIIHEFTINAIKEQLRYSDKSIKEISNEMGFFEESFFVKFFRQHVKMTPREYRRKILKQKHELKEDCSDKNTDLVQQTVYSKDAKLNKEISSLYSALGLLLLV